VFRKLSAQTGKLHMACQASQHCAVVHGTQVHGTQSMAQTYRVCRILLLSQKCLLLGLKLQLDA
jgi:hypothetical protein